MQFVFTSYSWPASRARYAFFADVGQSVVRLLSVPWSYLEN